MRRAISEVVIFILIHASFKLLPLLIGFTLYFATWHSFKVLTEEFAFLKRSSPKFQLGDFIKKLMPFSLLSFFGLGMLFFISQSGFIQVSEILLLFILLSVLTLPHSIVMDGFYSKFMAKPKMKTFI